MLKYQGTGRGESEFMGMLDAANFAVELVPDALLHEEYRSDSPLCQGHALLEACFTDHGLRGMQYCVMRACKL